MRILLLLAWLLLSGGVPEGIGQAQGRLSAVPGDSSPLDSNETSTAQPPDTESSSSISAALSSPVASSVVPAAAPEDAPARGDAPAPGVATGYAPGPAPSQADRPVGPLEGPDLPTQFNTTFEQDPDVVNGTVIIVLKNKDELPSASLSSAVNIKKRYEGTSKGALLIKVSANQTIASTIEKAMADPSVKYAEPNYILRASDLLPNDPSFSALQWNMPKISMPKAWGYTQGAENVLVCVIDTGIDYLHSDLAPNMASGSSLSVNGLPSVSLTKGFNAITDREDAMDDNMHGTHCAGVIGAKGNNNVGIAGVNWAVKLTGCKFLDSSGSGSVADALQCLDWCVNGAGATISSNSWGGGGHSQSMRDAIAAAEATNQHLFIAAAGNENNNNDISPSYPASYPLPNVISVAATGRDDALAGFSNYGATSVHIAAPGVNIYSTVPTQSYASLSGTSMACPHVAGAAAMLRGKDRTLTAQEVKLIIMSYGDTVSGLNNKVVGSKRLNVGAAVEYLFGRTPGAPIPAPPREAPTLPTVGTYTPTTLPFTSATALDFADANVGKAVAIDGRIALKCGDLYSERMMFAGFKKVVLKLDFTSLGGTIPATFRASDCDMPAGFFDTVSVILKCPVSDGAEDLESCVCYSDDDGCTGSGGDIVNNVPLDATGASTYYSVIMPYNSERTAGTYKLSIADASSLLVPPTPPPGDANTMPYDLVVTIPSGSYSPWTSGSLNLNQARLQ